jgi:hypothetical protein
MVTKSRNAGKDKGKTVLSQLQEAQPLVSAWVSRSNIMQLAYTQRILSVLV